MPFHLQTQPSSRLPSVSGHRNDRMPPPVPFLRAATDFRVPQPSLTLPSLSRPDPPTAKRSSKQYSQRYLIPPNSACPSGSTTHAIPAHAPPAGHQTGSIFGTPIAAIGGRALRHGSDLISGNVDFDEKWIESHLAELEAMARKDSGEKGTPFLGIWLGIREAGLREKQSVLSFIVEKLRPYPWYQGNETIKEALRALARLEFVNAGLLAKKHTENANWFWNKKIGNLKVRDYWMGEGAKLRQREEAQNEAQN